MDVRASGAEHDSTVQVLRDAAVEGRLTFEELADGIEDATGATTCGEPEHTAVAQTGPQTGASVSRGTTVARAAAFGLVVGWRQGADRRARNYRGHTPRAVTDDSIQALFAA